MTAVLLACGLCGVCLGETLNDVVETRLLAYFGGPTARDVKTFLTEVKVTPGSYATTNDVLFMSTHIGPPPSWHAPGMKSHLWYTNNYIFKVYYNAANAVIHSEKINGIPLGNRATRKKPPEKK